VKTKSDPKPPERTVRTNKTHTTLVNRMPIGKNLVASRMFFSMTKKRELLFSYNLNGIPREILQENIPAAVYHSGILPDYV